MQRRLKCGGLKRKCIRISFSACELQSHPQAFEGWRIKIYYGDRMYEIESLYTLSKRVLLSVRAEDKNNHYVPQKAAAY